MEEAVNWCSLLPAPFEPCEKKKYFCKVLLMCKKYSLYIKYFS